MQRVLWKLPSAALEGACSQPSRATPGFLPLVCVFDQHLHQQLHSVQVLYFIIW